MSMSIGTKRRSRVWLEAVEVARSRGFRAHEMNDILAMVEEHRTRLLEAWHEHFG